MTQIATASRAPLERSVIETQALKLREAHRQARPIPPLRADIPGAGIADAYAIQAENTGHWLKAGRALVGAKIGLTAKAVQRQLGVEQPDFGALFADMSVLDGDEIDAGRLIQPKVEAEVAFVLSRTPNVDRLTAAELIGSIAYILPAIEIVDSRIALWDISIIDTIADNASSGLFVLGSRPVAFDAADLRLCGMVMERNGEPVSFGAGAACLGHPLKAVAWLARQLAAFDQPLQEGDVVLSGALGPMTQVAPGDVFEARIHDVGTVQVSFAQEDDHA